MCVSNGLGNYNYYYPSTKSRITTKVTVYEYDEKGNVTKETITETTTEPVQDYSQWQQPYWINSDSGITINTDTDTYKATWTGNSS